MHFVITTWKLLLVNSRGNKGRTGLMYAFCYYSLETFVSKILTKLNKLNKLPVPNQVELSWQLVIILET